jgi:AcrR family transcriptional regulator
MSQSRSATAPTRLSSRSKRASVLAAAVEYFGQHGYDDTKWADIAGAVGIGPTALYHYFESKQHCLYEIMSEALASHREVFRTATANPPDYETGLVSALRSGFDLTEHEVLRMRVLVDKQGSVAVRRSSPREEAARALARDRTRDLEFDWAAFLIRGMQQGIVPEADARLMARAVLGLNTSVWQWFRPSGTLALREVADFYIRRQLAMIGLRPELQDEK